MRRRGKRSGWAVSRTSPSFQHQALTSRILSCFVEIWCPRTGGVAIMQVNVSTQERWNQDYRIPDLSVMLADRVPHGEAMFARPNVVFAIRSPGDETYEKLPFYAAVGVEAVVVVERDTKAVQVFTLSEENFVLAPPSADGWALVGPVGVELRAESIDGRSAPHLRLRGEPETTRQI